MQNIYTRNENLKINYGTIQIKHAQQVSTENSHIKEHSYY